MLEGLEKIDLVGTRALPRPLCRDSSRDLSTTITQDDWGGMEGEPPAEITMEIDAETVTILDDGEIGFEGTYTAFRDTLEVTDGVDTVTAHWSFAGGQLRFTESRPRTPRSKWCGSPTPGRRSNSPAIAGVSVGASGGCAHRVVPHFCGNVRAYVAPSSTHFASCLLVRTSSGPTRNHPRICRPRISMGRAVVVATRVSDCSGSTRTNTPPWPLAATAMLPPMRKASPPNIFFSVRSALPPSSSRMRSASSSSYATTQIVVGSKSPGRGRSMAVVVAGP